MTTRVIGSVLTVCLTAFFACGETRTWNGGGGDAKWSTADNWGGAAPEANDTLVFSGTTRLASTNDLSADTAFTGIVFSNDAGAFALGGNRLTLAGSVSNLSTSAQTLNLDMVLTGVRVLDASRSNVAVTVNGALSGAGGLTKTGFGSLTLTASNSYDGVTTINNGMLAITHSFALGSTNGNTVVNSSSVTVGGGYLQLSNTIIVPEPLVLFGERNVSESFNRFSLLNVGGTNTLSGPITRQQTSANTRIHLVSGTRLNITGGVTGSTGMFVMRVDNAILAFYGKPLNIGSAKLWVEVKGTIIFGVAGNVWSDGSNLDGSYTVRMEAPDALAIETPFRIGSSAAGSLTLDMNGFDQRIGKLYTDICTSGTRIITTPTPATLTADQSVNTHLDARLTGPLSLIKTGAGTLTLSNSVANTTTLSGSITVSNGTLVVAAPNNLGNATNVTVAGGTLEISTPDSIKDAARLSINNSGKVKINGGLMETVDTLFLDGVQQASGSWGTTASGAAHPDDSRFAGTGKLYVSTDKSVILVNATWDAEGADTRMSTTNNWVGDTLPAFDGTTRAFFGTGGTTATVDTAVNLYGITFNATNDVTIDSAGGTLTLGAGGMIAAIPDTTSRTYTLAQNLTLSGSQTWTATTNMTGVTKLAVTGAITDGNDPFGITKAGNGVLVLAGDNSYKGTTYLNEGVIAITHNNALGSTSGATIIADGARLDMQGGICVAEPVALPSDASTLNAGGLRATGGSNVWSGQITSSMSNSRINCNGGSLDIIGGIVGGQICLGGLGGSYVRVSEKPINIPTKIFFAHTSIPIILAVTNNVWSGCEISGNYVRTDRDQVLPPTASLTLGTVVYSPTPSGLDMNGHNQTVQQLKTYDLGAILILCSPTPATLTVNQSVDTVFHGNITGLVSLVKMGGGSLTLTRTNSTFGSFVVSNGTLAVSSTGTLGVNSTNIVVAGGTLSLSNSVAMADTASLFIANGGSAKVALAAGVIESVGYLYFGDKQQRAGTYSAAAGSGVQVVDTTHFAGTGILRVLRDSSGTLISLR